MCECDYEFMWLNAGYFKVVEVV